MASGRANPKGEAKGEKEMKDLKAMGASWGRSFLSSCIAVYLAGVTDPKAIIGAGVASILPVILRWLNPNDAHSVRRSECRRMDGGGWACPCGAHCHLFVNEIHGEVDHARISTEWWEQSQGSSLSN